MVSQPGIWLKTAGIEGGEENVGVAMAPTVQPRLVEVTVVCFAFDPEGIARGGGEGSIVGLGAAETIGSGQVEAEGGFADTGLGGEDGEEAG